MVTQRATRRGFLGALAAGFALDPERLLWRPGARLISVPAPVAPPLNWVERRWLAEAFGGRLPKIGDTIMVRRPARFRPNPGFALRPWPIEEVQAYTLFPDGWRAHSI